MVKNNTRNPGESGQMLILFVLGLGVLMGMMAMTIDVGLILHERRSLQNAADAAALAAVAELPDSPSAATANALEWVEMNGYDSSTGATVTVNTPYQGNPAAVEVIIDRDQPFVFAVALGLDKIDVHARAVATRDPSSAYEPAIFAASSGCADPKEVETSSANIDVVGGIISNGSVKMTGSDIVVEGSLTYICDDPLLNDATFTGGLIQVTDPVDWPGYFQYADFACDFQSNESNIPWIINPSDSPSLYADPSTGVLNPGVYCHNSDINVSQGATGNVTFVSKKGVYFSGGPYNLTAYQNDVVIFSEKRSTYVPCTGNPNLCAADAAVHISSNGFTWEGIIFALKGKIQFSASSMFSPSGGLWGDTVKISASSGSITGLIDSEPSWGAVRLVE